MQQNLDRANYILESRINSVNSKTKAKALAMENQSKLNKDMFHGSLNEKKERQMLKN